MSKNTENIFEQIQEIIKDNLFEDNKVFLLSCISEDKTRSYFISQLSHKFERIEDIDFLIQEFLNYKEYFIIFNILKESLNEDNIEYILDFLNSHKDFINLSEKDNKHDLHTHQSLEILLKIVSEYKQKFEEVFELLMECLKPVKKELREMRYSREFDMAYVAKIIKAIYENNKDNKEFVEKMVDSLKNYFNLINDEGGFSMYTPDEIFDVYKGYLMSDFNKNFDKVFEIIAGQYQDSYGGDFEGWEWAGGGISQSGSHYSVTDRHFVFKIISPAIEKYYEDDKNRWDEIKERFVAQKEDDVSKEKPDFLTRSVIELLKQRYIEMEGENKQEVFDILKNLILQRKGIPHKSDLVYQSIVGSTLSPEDKIALVQVSINAEWNKNKLPANVFIEQIVSDLASQEFEPAITLLESWVNSDEYTKMRTRIWGSNIVNNIAQLLNSDKPNIQKKGVELFEKYIKSDGFKNDLERFDCFEVVRLLTSIIEKDPDKGIEIVKNAYSTDTDLTVNEQLLICYAPSEVKDKDIRMRIYKEHIVPIFFEDLESDITKISDKFTDDYARQSIVKIGDELAKAKNFKEALEIAKLFIDDPDPKIENEEDDPKGEHNLHKKIEQGEDVNQITSVRGQVSWLLHQFMVLDGRDYIPEVTTLVDEKLSKDPNNYIRQQACFPLAELARARNSVMPDDIGDRFLSKDLAIKIEEIAFRMMRENGDYMAIMKNLAHVFGNIRSLNTESAWEVVNTFGDSPYKEVREKFNPLLIFFAEFRKDAFEGVMWSELEDFDDSKFKEFLKDRIKNEDEDEVKGNLCWHFVNLIDKESSNKGGNIKIENEKLFPIVVDYLKLFLEKYSPSSTDDIFRFVDDNIEDKSQECLDLFIVALQKECEYFKEKYKETGQVMNGWVPFDWYKTKILDKLIKQKETDGFLLAMKIIFDYPQDQRLPYDINRALNHLATFPKDTEIAKKIFEKLDDYPQLYDIKQKWLNQ